MSRDMRAIRPDASIILPDLAELQTDDLGLVSLIASRSMTFLNREGMHHGPCDTIQKVANSLMKDYHILSWMSKPTGEKAQMTSIQELMALGVEDKQEVIVDLRGPKVFGVERLEKVLDALGELLEDSGRLELIDTSKCLAQIRKALGRPLTQP